MFCSGSLQFLTILLIVAVQVEVLSLTFPWFPKDIPPFITVTCSRADENEVTGTAGPARLWTKGVFVSLQLVSRFSHDCDPKMAGTMEKTVSHGGVSLRDDGKDS